MQGFRIGVAALLGFVAAQAFRDVYLRHLFGNLGLFDVALVAFGTVAAVFGCGLAIFGGRQIRLLRTAWWQVIAVNVTTLVAWLSYFGSLRLVEPAAVNLAFPALPLRRWRSGVCSASGAVPVRRQVAWRHRCTGLSLAPSWRSRSSSAPGGPAFRDSIRWQALQAWR